MGPLGIRGLDLLKRLWGYILRQWRLYTNEPRHLYNSNNGGYKPTGESLPFGNLHCYRAHSNTDSNTNTNTDTDTNTDPDADIRANANANTYADSDTNADPHAYIRTNADPYADSSDGSFLSWNSHQSNN